MANLGSMTTRFERPSGCATAADVYYTQYSTNDAMYFFQGPRLDHLDCYPPNFRPSVSAFYSPAAACPVGYTSACSRLNQAGTVTETVVTCCPSIRSTPYVCQLDPKTEWPWQFSLLCISGFPPVTSSSQPVMFSKVTIVSGGTTSVSSTVRNPGHGEIGAYGIQLRFQSGDLATITSDTMPGSRTSMTTNGPPPPTVTRDPSAGGSSGLSSGAAAGIGIGVGLAAIFLGVGAFLAWGRRRRDATRYSAASPEDPSGPPPGGPVTDLGEAERKPYQYATSAAGGLLSPSAAAADLSTYRPDRPLSELQGQDTFVHEMAADPNPVQDLRASSMLSPGVSSAGLATPGVTHASPYTPSMSHGTSSVPPSSPQELYAGSPQEPPAHSSSPHQHPSSLHPGPAGH